MTRRLITLVLGLAMAAPAVTADGDEAAQPAPSAAEASDAGVEPVAPTASETPVTSSAADIDLATTAIKGSQELPRVLVIVPWKKAQPGRLEGRPANSLLDEALAPVDRDVFARQIGFYTQIHSDNTEE